MIEIIVTVEIKDPTGSSVRGVQTYPYNGNPARKFFVPVLKETADHAMDKTMRAFDPNFQPGDLFR